MKAPINAPANFLVLEGEKSRPAKPNEGCHSPLVDPKSGITLRLARSSSGHGDYVVPGGTYGVLADELLRVDCATGAPLGIVPR